MSVERYQKCKAAVGQWDAAVAALAEGGFLTEDAPTTQRSEVTKNVIRKMLEAKRTLGELYPGRDFTTALGTAYRY